MNDRELRRDYIKSTQRKTYMNVLLIASALVVCIICIVFVWSIKNVTHTETERYLTELSNSVADTAGVQLAENIKELQSIAMTYSASKADGTLTMDYLQEKADLLDFTRVSIVSRDGSSVGSDGLDFDFGDMEDIMGAFDGSSRIAIGDVRYTGTYNSFIYAVPIYEDGVITSVMAACNTSAWLDQFVNREYFGGAAFFHIFTPDGTFVTHSDNQNAAFKGNNVFDALSQLDIKNGNSSESIRQSVENGESGCIYYTGDDGQDRIMFYCPIDNFDFYISIIVMEKAATRQFNILLRSAVGINIAVALIYIALIIALILIYRSKNKQLSKIAFVDGITGGSNNMKFTLDAENVLSAAQPNEYMFVSLNIAKFKLINDAFGNDVGNKVLSHVYNNIKKNLKDGELVCRTGSDRFAILIKALPEDDVLRLMQKICSDINDFNKTSDHKYFISITTGVYSIEDPRLSIISIRDRATMARKKGEKISGRHVVTCIFYSDLERRRQHREKKIENKMDAALRDGEFVVYLQPKIATSGRKIIGAEALVRWNDKEEGLIPPNDFIPLFERNGFIVKLDLYVFEQVCKYIRKWIDCGVEAIPVSVNLSRRHLDDRNFLDKYIEIQERYEIPPELIEIELTETLVFENFDMIVETINKLHEHGFKCSLDDFGSGYSSLNMLKDINVDIIKLDREFFKTIGEDDARERAVVESVVSMAKKLNMSTISEGIETTGQLDFLESINCDMAQGFVISRPIPIDAFESMVFGKEIKDDKDKNKKEENKDDKNTEQ